jgi:hypothetical protein
VNRRSHPSSNHFAPSIIIDTIHAQNLTIEQLQFLNQGPTYVPPGQMHVSSSFTTLLDMVLQQSLPLRHQLSSLFSNSNIHNTHTMTFEEEIFKLFKNSFSLPLPLSIEKRALNEKNLVRSIRLYLKENNLILTRTADQQNLFYLTNVNDFERKIHDYFKTTDSFQLLVSVDENRNEEIQLQLDKIVDTINLQLQTMYHDKHIKEEQLKHLIINRSKVEFPYFFFLPHRTKVSYLFLCLAPLLLLMFRIRIQLSNHSFQLDLVQ